ncbi:NAD(P)-dependent oxidoreductase [Amycolatopsis sp. SB7-3]|uniref:NAD(P)-dependent oxidoreductase n=1 Tax=Amycolatopsis sp. SB7-3 TaxID=3373438 RepID=UPI003742B198
METRWARSISRGSTEHQRVWRPCREPSIRRTPDRRTEASDVKGHQQAGDPGMKPTEITVVGLGNMGAAMAHRLLESGFAVTVHNRTAGKAAPLVAAGATLAESIGTVARAELILLSLSDEAAVDEVLFEDLLPRLRRGTFVIDTSAVSPGYARVAARRLADAGVRRVEASVVGNPRMARSGGLRVFTAGERDDAESVRDVLNTLSQDGFVHLGQPGQASALKLAFNLLLGAQTVALAEAVAFAAVAGLDRGTLLDTVLSSGVRSPVLAFRAEFMRTGSYEPAAFRARLMEKDVRLLLSEAQGAGVTLPLADTLAHRYAGVVAAGDGDQDAAVVLATHEADVQGTLPRNKEEYR